MLVSATFYFMSVYTQIIRNCGSPAKLRLFRGSQLSAAANYKLASGTASSRISKAGSCASGYGVGYCIGSNLTELNITKPNLA